ncbi:MAG: homoserine kinase [Bacteroidota bacterium]
MPQIIRVFAPATVANVSCGFDVLGFAVDSPGDTVEVYLNGKQGVTIDEITGDEGRLSLEANQNTAGIAAAMLLAHIGKPELGVGIKLHKQMPLGSGMGSSAASAVAAAVAVNALLGEPLSRRELLPFALEGERIACGSAHADNAAPSLLGGFVLIRSYSPLDVISIPVPEELFCCVIHPHVEVQTRDARGILRQKITMEQGIKQWGNVGGLIAGLMMKDYDLIGRSLHDEIVEPVRAMLIPGFGRVKAAAMQAGALGGSISGSGPSLFALCRGEETANKVAIAMKAAFLDDGIGSETYVSKVNREGATVRVSAGN